MAGLGADFELVRAPIKRLMLLGGLYIDKRRIDEFLNPFGSFRNFIGVIRTLARYAIDRTRFPGAPISGPATRSLRVRCSACVSVAADMAQFPMVSLVRNPQGGVAGVAICRDGKLQRIRARKGVILQPAGFPRNAALLEELAGGFPHDQSVGYEGNVGDTLQAARQAGAAIDSRPGLAVLVDAQRPGTRRPTAVCRRCCTVSRPQSSGHDRRERGRQAVRQRFGLVPRHCVRDVQDGVTPDSRFYLICDRRFVWKRGLGNLIKPYCLSLGRYVRSGYISTGRSIRELRGRDRDRSRCAGSNGHAAQRLL